jgi:hypothetical protein
MNLLSDAESSDDEIESFDCRPHTYNITTNKLDAAFVRTQPHIRGNWSGHIRGTVVLHNTHSLIQSYLQCLDGSSPHDVILEHTDCHISLSKPFYIQVGSIEPLARALQQHLQHAFAVSVTLAGKLQVLHNEERTRSFLTVPVCRGADRLQYLTNCVDAVLRNYGLAVYYDDPIFHVSIASWNYKADGGCCTTEKIDVSMPPQYCRVDHVRATFGGTREYVVDLQS